jgi:cytochrome c peroxidase
MNKLVKGAVLTLFICLGLSACGEQEKVKAPTNLPTEEQSKAQGDEIEPKELLTSLRNQQILSQSVTYQSQPIIR